MRFIFFLSLVIVLVLASEGRTQTYSDADFDGDGMVGFSDFVAFARAYGSSESRYDINKDGVVGFRDFIFFASFYGWQTVSNGTGQIAVTPPGGSRHEMVLIPAGEFTMGAEDGNDDEHPVHSVFLDAYYIDKFEVTNRQYSAFLDRLRKDKDEEGNRLLGNRVIDDFESAEFRFPLPISKQAWSLASTPTIEARSLAIPKGRLTWFNPLERDRLSIYDIQPYRDDVTIEQSIVNILTLRFEPSRTNGFPVHTSDSQGGSPVLSWGGIMINSYYGSYPPVQSLELWVRGNEGRLHIDMGEISEEIELPLDELNTRTSNFRTEDRPLSGGSSGDGIATSEEDVGLDGLTDAQEKTLFQLLYPQLPIPDDPSGDNFQDADLAQTDPDLRYPPGINGSQGNNAERNSMPDSEDLNQNGILDTDNNYIRYSVDLRTNRGFDPATDTYAGPSLLVSGSQSDLSDRPWRLLSIPLRGKNAPRLTEGLPDTAFSGLDDNFFVRLWIEDYYTTTVEIYTLNVVNGFWHINAALPSGASGELRVKTINTESPVYDPPPGVDIQVDPVTGARLPEHSLVLEYENLFPGEEVSATRILEFGSGISFDSAYVNSGILTMFLHGGNPSDASFLDHFPAPEDILSNGPSPVEFFVRLWSALDNPNSFYEYRSRVYRGWAQEINTARIDLAVMSGLKAQLAALHSSGRVAAADTLSLALQGKVYLAQYDLASDRIAATLDGHTYVVQGDASIALPLLVTVGIRNRSDRILEEKGEVWLDEFLREDLRIESAQYADHPVVDVSWYGAKAYCEWIGGRLPTEAEWEKAARGVDSVAYPWGNQEPGTNLANFMETANPDFTTEVGSYPGGISPYGVYDMAGNALEWVLDVYDDNYYERSPASNPLNGENKDHPFFSEHVLRGGNWASQRQDIRTTSRFKDVPQVSGSGIGFRCVLKVQ